MSLTRFMQGVLKGDIANMQAEQARQAEEEKRKRDEEAKNLAYERSLATTVINQIELDRFPAGFDFKSEFKDIANSDNPFGSAIDLVSKMEKKNDLTGLKFMYDNIFPIIGDKIPAKDMPTVVNKFLGLTAGVTDMKSLDAKMSEVGSLFEGITDDTVKFSDEQNFLADQIKAQMKKLSEAKLSGKTLSGEVLVNGNLPDMPKDTSVAGLQTFLNKIHKVSAQDVPKDDKPFSPNDYTFTVKGKSKVYKFDDISSSNDIVKSMTDITNTLIREGYDFTDPVLQKEYENQMDAQRLRADAKFKEESKSPTDGSINVGRMLNINAYTDDFRDNPMFEFALPMFNAFEMQQPYNIVRSVKPDGSDSTPPKIKNKHVDTGEFKDLSSTLGYMSDAALFQEFNHLQVDRNDVQLFKEAQNVLRNVPGLFMEGTNRLQTLGSRELPMESQKKLMQELAKLGTATDARVQDQIHVISILSNLQAPTIDLGADRYSLPTHIEDYIISIASSVTEGKVDSLAQASGIINKKVSQGEIVMDLVNAQISLLNDPSGNSAESGLARTLSMAVTGYFGEGGQIEQIRDLITGGFGTGLEFKQEDFDSKEDYDAAVDSAINYIGLAANSQPKDFVKNAIAYTNEVLLTYHIAKFNDDGGRLSNQDYTMNLNATAGGAASSRGQATVHLQTVKKRFQKDYTKFKMFQFNESKLLLNSKMYDMNPDSPTYNQLLHDPKYFAKVLFRRMDAARQYYDIYDSAAIKRGEFLSNYPINEKINAGLVKIAPINRKVNNPDSKEHEFPIFQVLNPETNEPILPQDGGVYVVPKSEGSTLYKAIAYEDVPTVPLGGDSIAPETQNQMTSPDEGKIVPLELDRQAGGFVATIIRNGKKVYLTQQEVDELNSQGTQ